jgi:hypothetical protein
MGTRHLYWILTDPSFAVRNNVGEVLKMLEEQGS